MPILNFPTNPAVNETYTFEGKTWYWTGQGWRLTSQGAINGIPIGNITPASGAFTTLAASFLTAGPATFTGNVIASNVRTGNLSVTGNINGSANVVGNLSAAHITANQGLLVNGPATVTGNVTGSYFIGNGSQLTGIVASGGSSIDNGQSNVRIASANANITVGVSGVGNVMVIDPAGVTLNGYANVSGNIIGANFTTAGNVAAAFYTGNGRFLTGLVSTLEGNVTGNINTGEFWINSANGEIRFGNTVSVTGNAIVANDLIVGEQIAAAGNVTANYFIGDGSQLTNLPAGNYSNANVAAYLPVYGGNVSAANVSANFYLGNGRFLTGINTTLAGNLEGNINTGEFWINSANGEVRFGNTVSVVGNIIGTNSLVIGDSIATAGNVTANYFIGDGSQLTNLPAGNYSNANVAAYLPTYLPSYTGNLGAANVSANYYLGNGRFLTGIVTSLAGQLSGNIDTLEYSINSSDGEVRFGNTISVIGNAIVTDDLIVGDQIAASGNITTAANVYAQNFIGNVYGNIFANILVPGANTEVLFNDNGSANASAAFTFDRATNSLAVGNEISAAGNITGANFETAGQVTATGNVSGDYFIGNGRFLTGIDTTLISNGSANVKTYANANVAVSTGNTANVAVFSDAGASVLGTVLASGNIVTPANVIADYFVGNFVGNISGNLTVPGSNTQVLFNSNGNADATSGLVFDKTSNTVTVGNVVSAVGNVVAGNVVTAGNVTANYFLGNGRQLTGLPDLLTVSQYTTGNISNVVANVSALRFDTTTGFIVNDLGNGEALIEMGSSFKTWIVAGQANLVAVGEDEVEFIAGNGIVITTNANAYPQSIEFTHDGSANAALIFGNTLSANITDIGPLNSLSVVGNVVSGNFVTSGNLDAVGITSGNISVSGNVYAGTFVGNISGNIDAGGANTEIQFNDNDVLAGSAAFTFNKTSNTVTVGGTLDGVTISASGNIAGGNINTVGMVAAQGNVSGGNIVTGNDVVAIGNISGSYVLTTQIQGSSVTITATGANQGIDLVPNGLGNINVNSHYINNLLDPQQAQDAATKAYVDSVAEGLNIHDAVEAATPDTLANISGGTVNYNNGNAGVGANLVTTGSYVNVDGVNIASANTRILVKDEANAVWNGVYVYSNATVLTRAADYDSTPEVERGDFLFVSQGTLYGNTGWVQTSNVTAVGTSDVVFTQFSGAGTYQAGNGLSLNGVIFNVNVDPDTTVINGSNQVAVKASANLTTPNIGNATGSSVSLTGNIDVTNINAGGYVSATGNVIGGNLQTAGIVSATGNITGGNLFTAGTVSATGNVTGDYFIGNGRFLSGIDATLISNGNSNVKVYANSDVAVTVAGVANVAVFSTSGFAQTGNTAYFNANTFAVTDTIVEQGRGVNAAPLVSDNGQDLGAQLWFYDGSEKSAFTGFQRSSGKILLARDVAVANNVVSVNNYGNVLLGNIDGQNALLSGLISATGNISAGNLITVGNIDATGNVAGDYFIGNGRFLTGIDTTLISNGNSNVKVYANANVATTVAGTANVVVVSDTGQWITGTVSASGNITGANFDTTGSAVANVVQANSLTSTGALTLSAAANANIFISAQGTGITKITGTNGFVIPVGNTAQRPNYPSYLNVDTGTLRYNFTIGDMEVFNGNAWVTVGSSTGNITIVDQQITPDGTSNTYVLTQNATAASILVTWNGVQQIPNDSYTVTGNSITFIEPPLTTDAIDIRFLTGVTGPGSVYNTTGNSSVYVTDVPDIRFTVDNLLAATITANGVTDLSTGHSLQLPSYTTANAQALTGVTAGQVIYVADGDSGQPCLAVYSGGCWKRVALGSCISST